MSKVSIELNAEQVEAIVRQMDPVEQSKIERSLWATRMDTIVDKIRKNVRKNRITEKEISKICEEVRQELYEKRRHRH